MDITPRYISIAIDIATKIANNQYKTGESFSARSYIASKYGVSHETARRAVAVLTEQDIVHNEKKGMIVKSADNAKLFIKQQQKIKNLSDIQMNLINCIKDQESNLKKMNKYMEELSEKIHDISAVHLFIPYFITIEENNSLLNRSVNETLFWQNTGATIIAIKRGEDIILSPGPDIKFEQNDIYYFIGNQETYEKVKRYMSVV